jgi:HSP20 family protein
MAVVRYEPWSLISQLQGDINRAFDGLASTESSSATADWVPAADIEEYTDRFELFIDLPGVPASSVEVTLESGVLTVAGVRAVEQRPEQVAHHRRERSHGKFYRRFILPDTANSDEVRATERHGVLAVTIPKRVAAQPRRIEIASAH